MMSKCTQLTGQPHRKPLWIVIASSKDHLKATESRERSTEIGPGNQRSLARATWTTNSAAKFISDSSTFITP